MIAQKLFLVNSISISLIDLNAGATSMTSTPSKDEVNVELDNAGRVKSGKVKDDYFEILHLFSCVMILNLNYYSTLLDSKMFSVKAFSK